jgi:hypothetical protein
LQKTRLVLIDVKSRTQETLLESEKVFPGTAENVLMVLDRPQWIDRENLALVVIEYVDPEAMRLTRATISRVNLTEKILVSLAGSESYFDEKGNARGYKASMPKTAGGFITYVAIEGHLNRTPMMMTTDGKEKKVIALHVADFFGPVIPVGKNLVFGLQDGDGNMRLAMQKEGEKAARPLPFRGVALEPAVFP